MEKIVDQWQFFMLLLFTVQANNDNDQMAALKRFAQELIQSLIAEPERKFNLKHIA